jgi:tripartite-type tricarboxylate transporter receptor subunit TctC
LTDHSSIAKDLSAEVFKQNAKVDIVHVPYRGAREAVTAIARGDAQMYFAPIPSAQELGVAGKVAVVAINSSARAPQLPNVPTIAESGLPNYKYESWFGMLAPSGTSPPILDKISQDIAKAVSIPDVRAHGATSALPVTNTPKQFDVIIRNDTERNVKILREAGVAAD